jgi:hypothetical protein
MALLLACLLGVLALPSIALATGAIVTFPDPALDAAVRSKMGIPSGPIYASDLTTLTALTARDSGITNLDGLEYAKNLQQLNLDRNSITTVTPLAQCTSLSVLSLRDNSITDVAPLAACTRMSELYLDDNLISDLTPLSGLADADYVGLADNQVTSLGALAPLTQLLTLDVSGNGVADLSPLAGLTNLVILEADNTGVSDLGPLKGMTKLVYLSLIDDHIFDIGGLPDFTDDAATVDLRYNWIDLGAGTPATLHVNALRTQGLTVDTDPQNEGGGLGGLVSVLGGGVLDGVTVRLPDGRSTTTAGGSYAFGYLEPGTYTATYSKAGYTTETTSVVITTAATLTKDVSLKPLPGTLRGTVDSGGTGLVGASVSVAGMNTVTITGGAYTLGYLEPGTRTVTFSKPYYYDTVVSADVISGATSTLNVSLRPVSLAPALTRSPRGSSLTYKRKKGVAKFTLSATMIDARGPVAGAVVRLQKSSNGRKWSTVKDVATSASGTVSLKLSVKKKGVTYYRWYFASNGADSAQTTSKQKVRVK